MSRTLCIYHANCWDGIASAWVLLQRFPDAVFFPMNYGDELPETQRDDQVYMVDFSLNAKALQELALRVEYLTVIDHHKSAKEELQGFNMSNVTIIFDMNECGSTLAWRYFFPVMPLPALLHYIRAADIWKWEGLTSPHEVTAYIRSFPQTLATMDMVNGAIGHVLKDMIREGEAINRSNYQMVEDICKNAWFTDIQGYNVPTLNTNVLISLVGNRLCKMYPQCPFAATFFVRSNNDRVYSLRSIGDFDVSAVAKKFEGGGGHRNAAGFTLKGFEI